METLPIYAVENEIVDALSTSSELPRLLLRAPTGSGKSTGVPPLLAQAGWMEKGVVLVVQPRRMAARLLAQRVAHVMGCSLGKEVGYTVRFDQRVSAQTRIHFVTEGILERMLLDNPLLTGISAVVFDEFHERRLTSDLCLARLLNLQESLRQDMGIVVMSATLEVAGLAAYLQPCSVVEAEGQMYPVEVYYMPPKLISDGRGRMDVPPIWNSVLGAVERAVAMGEHGNILVFLPGSYEIRRTIELLEQSSRLQGFDIFPLYSSLPPERQNEAVNPGLRPKILVSTNVAETSLTIEGLRTVIDSGLARVASRDIRRELNTLTVQKISRASAAQRAGRAGRLATGRCFRLWSETDHAKRAEFEMPEILRVELSSALLSMSCWGCKNPEDFRWLTQPHSLSLQQAQGVLNALGALDDVGKLTVVGQKMSQYPLAPRLARLLVSGKAHECGVEMAFIAALVQGENIFTRAGEVPTVFCESLDYTDFQAEYRAVLFAEKCQYNPQKCQTRGVSGRAAREIMRSFEQLIRLIYVGQKLSFCPMPEWELHREGVILALIEGYADHVGARNGVASNTCKLVGGQSGKLNAGSAAFKERCFVAAEVFEVEGKLRETKISRCTSLNAEQLREACPDEWKERYVVDFDESKRRVTQRLQWCFRDLVLMEQEKGEPSPALAAPILAMQVASGGLRLTQWTDAVDQWIIRLNALSEWMPELELPHFREEDKVLAFSVLCEGALGYKEIKDRAILPILKDWLSGWQREALDKYAPTQICLSNGQTAKLRYDDLGIPRLGLTVQRLYGVEGTPMIAQGRVPVTVEILAPNQRPWQVTQNLASFWKTGYPQMRKELSARYPRQVWR